MATVKALTLSILLCIPVWAWTIDFVPVATNGSVTVEKVSIPGPRSLGAPKMNVTANKTSSDWWHFDAVSTIPRDETTVEIVFFNMGNLPTPHPLAVQVTGTFSNGSRFHKTAMAGDGATVTNDASGVRGQWKGAGANFSSTPFEGPNLVFTINMDSPAIGVHGTFVLKAVSTNGRLLTDMRSQATRGY